MNESGRFELKPMQRKSVKRWGIVLMVPLMVGVCVLGVLAWKWKESLTVQRVVIEGSRILSPKQIFALINVPLKSSMSDIDIYEMRQKILQQPFVKTATVSRHFPDAVCVDIVEREPIASVTNGQLRYIDVEAMLLPNVETAVKLDLPIINGIDVVQKAKVGETISDSELLLAIEILKTAREIDSSLYHFISEINMNNSKDIILYSTEAGVPIMLGRGDFAKKLLMLQSFWNNFVKSKDADKLRYIDLRFNDQVVVKWQSDEQLQRKTSL